MKRQLKLNLDRLEVESFGTTSEPAKRSGTVFGMITGPCDDTSDTCQLNCVPPPSEQTCATACYSGCETCASCQDTCWMTCSVYECGTCDFKTQCWQ